VVVCVEAPQRSDFLNELAREIPVERPMCCVVSSRTILISDFMRSGASDFPASALLSIHRDRDVLPPGLNLGIDFVGGPCWEIRRSPARWTSQEDAHDEYRDQSRRRELQFLRGQEKC